MLQHNTRWLWATQDRRHCHSNDIPDYIFRRRLRLVRHLRASGL